MFDVEKLVCYLEGSANAESWLESLGVARPSQVVGCLPSMMQAGLTLELVAGICGQFEEHLPLVSDPDRAINNLDRFISASPNPLALGSLMERERETLPTLLQIFSASQYLSDVLVRDPESFDLLRMTSGQPVTRDVLIEEICSEVAGANDDEQVMSSLRRYKHRETLRIAYGDLIGRHRLVKVPQQISHLADAICEAALRYSRGKLAAKYGEPRRSDGEPSRFVVLALGKLGGEELNYSSDIDLILLCEEGNSTDGDRSISHREFFDRLQRRMIKLLTESTGDGMLYRVDLRLRPHGNQSAAVCEVRSALRYYDTAGRTWERQAYVKARPVAGSLELGRWFLDRLESWVYRRYLSRADIGGIKALKRRIEQRSIREGGDASNLKTGRGGIRDVEFVIQFLQLLNAGDLPQLRTGNTLEAIDQLSVANSLTLEERGSLEENYSFLRRVEHRLQIMFDLQTHTLPADEPELRRLAIRAGYDDDDGRALTRFREDLQAATSQNRSILDHLLHDAFADDSEAELEADLVLDPNPRDDVVDACLRTYGFKNPQTAFKNLMALSTETVSFLSTRRCRHFLASIARRLLEAISQTPDPDATLVDLSRVSDSLGGKGVLWELFSSNRPSLDLYVRLCACSHYLTGLMTANPGMLDELMDSLVLDQLPSLPELDEHLQDLFRGAEDIAPIIRSFKDGAHLRVGVRDLLGKEDIRSTHQALSNIAEACLQQVTIREYESLAARYGDPICGDQLGSGKVCEFVILALGKLGGREPNYHSDLDIVFLYGSDGSTCPRGKHGESTSNHHFFGQLSQRIIKVLSQLGSNGRLYEVDTRLRPNGKSAVLAVSLREFQRYFHEGRGQLWERQALCKARPVYGSVAARAETMQAVRKIVLEQPWQPSFAGEIREMRYRLEKTASELNLKRGPGGTMDVEFIVQMLQLRNAKDHPSVVTPGTIDALSALAHEGCLAADVADSLAASYRHLRSVESAIRLMNTSARHDLPTESGELRRLAFLLRNTNAAQLVESCRVNAADNRRHFELIFNRESGE